MIAQEHASDPHEPGSLRELLSVAVSLMISAGALSVVNVIDRVFLTWWSVDAVAAAMPAGLVFWSAISLPMGIAHYTTTFVAQYDGAGDRRRLAQSVWQSAYIAAAAGLAMLALVPVCPVLFAWFGHSSNVRALEADYFSYLAFGAVPLLLASVLSAYFNGRGRTRIVMWTTFLLAAVNILLDYLLIFGVGPLPAFGVRGAAIATDLAYCVQLILLVALVARSARREAIPMRSEWRWDAPLVRRMMWFGLPSGLQMVIDHAGFTVYLAMIGRLGTRQLAATNIAFNINSVAFIPLIGLGIAVMSLVGKRIGEGKPAIAARSTWNALWLGLGFMLFCAGLYVAIPDLLLLPYAYAATLADFEEVRPTIVVLLRYVALFACFDAVAVVFGSAIRGAGDTRFSLAFGALVSIFGLALPLVWLSFIGWNTLHVSWTVLTLHILILAVGYYWRFRHGAWRAMSVIEPHLIEPPQPHAPAVNEPPAVLDSP